MINLLRQAPVSEQAAPVTCAPDHRGACTENQADASCAVTIEVESIAEQLAKIPRRLRTRADWARLAPLPILVFAFLACLLNGELPLAMLSLCALFTIRVFIRPPERQRRPRLALNDSQPDRHWLGGLAEALEWPDRRVRAGATLLLAERLPRVTTRDAELFSEEQCTCLYRRLVRRAALSDPELALAILRALPHIGTEAALPYVERLAKLNVLSGKGRRLREAARATLATLERRVASQREQRSVGVTTPRGNVETSLPREVDATSEDVENNVQTADNSTGIAGFPTPYTLHPTPSMADTGEGNGIAEVPSLVSAQLQEFEQELRRLRKPGMRIGFLFASWGIILPYCAVQTYLQFTAGNRLGATIFCALTLLGTRLHRLTLTNQHRLLARKFAKLDDVRCVGRLAEAMEWPDATVRHCAITALTRLLPRIAASDAALLTSRQRLNLHHVLKLENARNNAEFLCAILKALEQIGDAASVPSVEQLAKAQPTSARQRRVCDAARECLPFLENRARLNQSSQTLLRASSANAISVDMLVRPAGGASETDQQQLLRPGAVSNTM